MISRDDPGEPLDLGVVGPAPAGRGSGDAGVDDEPRRTPSRGRPGWRWWGALAAAAVAGAVGGLVVAEARDDAAGYDTVELFGGPVEPAVLGGGATQGELSISLLNAGERTIDILGVEVEGMTVAAGAEPADPVAAEPGTWTDYVQRDLEVDCTGPLPAAVHVRVRTESGAERLVEVEPPDDYGGLRGFWYVECQAFQFGLQVRDSTLVDTGGGTVVLALELANDGFQDLRIGAIAARAPGFALTTDAAELAIPAGQTVTVTTTWTVADCDLALQAAGGSLAVRIMHGNEETEQIIVLPDAGFTALARLSGQSCPATIQE